MQATLGVTIHNSLRAELTALRSFVGLLEQEQKVLLANDTDALLQLAEQKSGSALLLNQLVEKRTRSFLEILPDLKTATILKWLKQNESAALPLWQEINTLADRALKINASSGELIQLKMQHNQHALAVLSKSNDTANLYGPNGQRNLPSSSGKPIASV